MQWKQVCQTALAFSAARGATIVQAWPHAQTSLRLQCLRGTGELVVEQNNQDGSAWYVCLVRRARPPVYFPPVTTPDDLRRTLAQAWVLDRCSGRK
jgi:hypothetical protein